jgi:hypothetical protein
VKFLSERGVKTAPWMSGHCPWTSRAEFLAAFRSERMNTLRDLLASTVKLQSEFLAERMEAALPKMLESAAPGARDRVKANFQRLAATGPGTFALIDYVNFKGEGTNPKERYKGEGWGLLQVLQRMNPEGAGPAAFSRAAAETLERRVQNSPPERHEAQWLPGWKNRVHAYAGS